jgi:hypothetical protein
MSNLFFVHCSARLVRPGASQAKCFIVRIASSAVADTIPMLKPNTD